MPPQRSIPRRDHLVPLKTKAEVCAVEELSEQSSATLDRSCAEAYISVDAYVVELPAKAASSVLRYGCKYESKELRH